MIVRVPPTVIPGASFEVSVADLPAGTEKVEARLVKQEKCEVHQGGIAKTGRYSYEGATYVHEGKDQETCAISETDKILNNSAVVTLLVSEAAPPSVCVESTRAVISYTVSVTCILAKGKKSVVSAPITVGPRPYAGGAQPLKDTESIRMISCCCCDNGNLEVTVSGETSVFSQSRNAEFEVSFEGSGVAKLTSATISVGSCTHIQSTGAVQLVPVRNKMRSNTENDQKLTNVRAGRKYKMSIVLGDVQPLAKGRIVQCEHSIDVVIQYGAGGTERTLSFPVVIVL